LDGSGDKNSDKNSDLLITAAITAAITMAMAQEQDQDRDLASAAELAELCPVALSMHDEAGRFLSASAGCADLFAKPVATLRLQTLMQCVAPSDRETFLHGLAQALLGSETVRIRYRLQREQPDAATESDAHWVESELRRVSARSQPEQAAPQPVRVACATRRVSAPTQPAEPSPAGYDECDLVRRHRDQLVAMLPALVWYGPIGADGKTYKLSYMSEYLFRVSGYTSSQWFQTPGFWAERIHPEDREATLAATRRMLEEGSELAPYRFRIHDGSYLWLQSTIRIERDSEGKPVRMYGITLDVTRYKQAEHEAARLHRELAEKVAHILELSAPLLPTGDGSLVLPLIGTLDPARTEHALNQLLSRVVSLRARRVIIDLTGVAQADAQSTAALMRATQALRLLGAQPIVCGIRAEMALALGSHHEALAQITTFASLQEALRAAAAAESKPDPRANPLARPRPVPRQQT
jgi:rsbT co-antagonist protein RsbR